MAMIGTARSAKFSRWNTMEIGRMEAGRTATLSAPADSSPRKATPPTIRPTRPALHSSEPRQHGRQHARLRRWPVVRRRERGFFQQDRLLRLAPKNSAATPEAAMVWRALSSSQAPAVSSRLTLVKSSCALRAPLTASTSRPAARSSVREPEMVQAPRRNTRALDPFRSTLKSGRFSAGFDICRGLVIC